MFNIRIDETDIVARLPRLLDMVEQGQTIVIMRCGHPIAELAPPSHPTPEERRAQGRAAVEALEEYRRTAPSLGDLSIKEMIEEGRL